MTCSRCIEFAEIIDETVSARNALHEALTTVLASRKATLSVAADGLREISSRVMSAAAAPLRMKGPDGLPQAMKIDDMIKQAAELNACALALESLATLFETALAAEEPEAIH